MPSYQYLIKTHTGTAPTAGATASIAIQLCGSEGRFKDFKKLDNQKSEDYVSGDISSFICLMSGDHGEIGKIRVRSEQNEGAVK